MKNLTATAIKNALSQSGQNIQIAEDRRTKAAVLIPLFQQDGNWRVLFTRRSQNVQDHKGQVSFPGGAFEWLDENLEATALRETEEEIGIPPSKINILGRMEPFPSISNYIITPVVGVLDFPFDVKIAVDEVDRVFSIGLDWLMDDNNREVRNYTRSNGQVEKVLFYKEIDGEIVWGITARILTKFLDLLKFS